MQKQNSRIAKGWGQDTRENASMRSSLLWRQLEQPSQPQAGWSVWQGNDKTPEAKRKDHPHTAIRSDDVFANSFFPRSPFLPSGVLKTLSFPSPLPCMEAVISSRHFAFLCCMSAQFKTNNNGILEHARDRSTQREDTAVGTKQFTATREQKQICGQVLRSRPSARKSILLQQPWVFPEETCYSASIFCKVKGGQSAFSEVIWPCYHTSAPAAWFLPYSASTTRRASGGTSNTASSLSALLPGRTTAASHCAQGSGAAGSLPSLCAWRGDPADPRVPDSRKKPPTCPPDQHPVGSSSETISSGHLFPWKVNRIGVYVAIWRPLEITAYSTKQQRSDKQ